MTRWPWVSIETAAAMTAVGVSLLLDPDSYPKAPYHYTFGVARPELWGAAFLGTAVLFIGGIVAPSWRFHRRHLQVALGAVCAGLMSVVLFAWAGFLLAARLDSALNVSWNGPVIWTLVAVAHITSFARFGTGRTA